MAADFPIQTITMVLHMSFDYFSAVRQLDRFTPVA
jgi:hypothetical protein